MDPGESRRSQDRRTRARRRGAALGLVLHTAAVTVVWQTWELGLRSGILVWMDFPISLLYLGFAGNHLLAWSVVLGGAWWAVLGALVARGVGRITALR